MKYCSHCARLLTVRIPEGDTLPRYVCDACATIHYRNPRLVVGCVPEWEGRVLLCRRAIEPRKGLWTVPAGFMENDETTGEGALRETLEEACARVELGSPLAMINLVHVNQVHLMYRAKMLDGKHSAGMETLETALLSEDEIPWDNLAFRSVRFALEAWFRDRREGREGFHTHDLRQPPRPVQPDVAQ
jgi:ADP-ribose pyrophosphatase YjhB (NUDIX family)